MTISEIKKLTDNHIRNVNLPVLTQAVFVGLDELKTFISNAEKLPRCDTIKISFIRYSRGEATIDDRIKHAGKNLSQVSLIFVPVDTINLRDWSNRDLINDGSEKIETLCVCEPGQNLSKDDLTGLCPPASGCPPPNDNP